jgi:hypothetical protein
LLDPHAISSTDFRSKGCLEFTIGWRIPTPEPPFETGQANQREVRESGLWLKASLQKQPFGGKIVCRDQL